MNMGDSTVKKVDARHSPRGEMGQKYLVSGKTVSMRLWEREEPGAPKPPTRRDFTSTMGLTLETAWPNTSIGSLPDFVLIAVNAR